MSTFKRTRLLLCLGVLTAVAWGSVFAAFTDSGTATSTFTAGTVDLVLGGDTDDAYAFSSLEMSDMKPGSEVYAPLTVANTGTLDFAYDLATGTVDTGGALGTQLQLEAKVVAAGGDCVAGAAYTAASTVITAGAMSAAAVTDRALNASASEILCFKVSLPSDTANSFQGAQTTATFTFSADNV
ncbi:MAG TPA: TasA family protein [Acidimicrobiales bacterium]|nr:TasA family protein [Acidimicrobiales bacterium]